RCTATLGTTVFAWCAGDLVGHLGEVVSQVPVAELGLAQVPAMFVGGVKALALQCTAPAPEHAPADTGGDELGGDVVGEAQQRVNVDVPAVGAVGDLHDPRPAEQAAEQVGVLHPRGAGGDRGP